MTTVHHRYATVNGRRMFYREAGPAGAPVVVLLHDLPLYPKLHAWLRNSGVPVLAVWGRNDEIFQPEGALAFAQDAPGAEICLLDGRHVLLESHLDIAAGHIRGFLSRTLP